MTASALQGREYAGESYRAYASLQGPAANGFALRVALTAASAIVRRHPLQILLVSTLVAAAAFAASFLIMEGYSATATIVVDPRIPNVTQGTGVLPHIGSDVIAIESLVQVTKSHGYLERLAQRLSLYQNEDPAEREKAIERLSRRLNVARRGTTYVVEATAVARTPEQSAEIANAAAREIIEDHRAQFSGVDEKTSADIERRLDAVRNRLFEAERAAADMKVQLKITDVGAGSTLLERRVDELNRQHVIASAKASEARARYDRLRSVRPEDIGNLDPLSQSTVLNALKAQRAELMRQHADQATTLGPRHPLLVSIDAQIAESNRQIRIELGRIQAAARNGALEAEQQEASLAQQLLTARQDGDKLGPQLGKLDELEREAKAERAAYEQLLTRQRELAATRNLEPSDIRLVSPATPPSHLKPSIPMRATLACALGLVFGFASAFLRKSGGAANPPESLVGVETAERPPVRTDKPAKAHAPLEPVRSLDDLLLAVTSKTGSRPVHSVLVCSSRRGAGASGVAAALAQKLAHEDSLVLLIQAARPESTRRGEHIGLIDVLAREETFQEAVIARTREGYAILPFGGTYLVGRVDVGALIRGSRLSELLAFCRGLFHYVVIEGPPVQECVYADVLGRLTDLSVLVATPGLTSQEDVEDALERLHARMIVAFLKAQETAARRDSDGEALTPRRKRP